MPSFSATRAACSGAAPPKAISVRVARVLAALDGMDARGIGHVLVDHLADAERGKLGAKAQALADVALERRLGAGAVERHLAAGEAAGSMRPSTRSASVTVGSLPPRP